MINLQYKAYSCDPAIVDSRVAKLAKFKKSVERRSRLSIQEQAADPRVSELHREHTEDCRALLHLE
jgi:hypothetical protein